MLRRSVIGAVVGAAVLLSAPAAEAAKRIKMEIENADDIGVSIWGTVEPRYFKAGFRAQREMPADEYDRAATDAMELMGKLAEQQGASRFAVTGMFCLEVRNLYRITSTSCAIEGAWLFPGERVESNSRYERPVYFSTKEAVERMVPMDWVERFDRRVGLAGKVVILKGRSAN